MKNVLVRGDIEISRHPNVKSEMGVVPTIMFDQCMLIGESVCNGNLLHQDMLQVKINSSRYKKEKKYFLYLYKYALV